MGVRFVPVGAIDLLRVLIRTSIRNQALNYTFYQYYTHAFLLKILPKHDP